MNISHFSLRRPVFAIVMNLAIVIFGVIGFCSLPVVTQPHTIGFVGVIFGLVCDDVLWILTDAKVIRLLLFFSCFTIPTIIMSC